MPLLPHAPQHAPRTTEELIRHMQSFSLDLKFSAGVWFFFPAGLRFHEPYGPRGSIEQILTRAAQLKDAGLSAIEAHYPNEINEHNLPLYQDFIRDTGIRLLTVIPNLFYDACWEWGSLSNPIPEVRAAAIQRTREALQLNQELGTDFAVVWPGIDGYENSFGLDLPAMRWRFNTGLAAALDAVPGVRIALEPKPYEPRGRILVPTTSDGLLCCRNVEAGLTSAANQDLLGQGRPLMGLNPEIGHLLMAYEDPASSLSLCMEEGRLFHTHWNSQPLGNYDQDLDVGVISPELGEAALYALKMGGYTGYFGIDIFPERLPVERALINSFDALRAMNDRIEHLDHEKILRCQERPDKNRGYLEALLLRARARDAGKLSPLPEFEE
ncbi:MAG: TIM barrel protein [Chloroflexaceae bacterium]